MILNIRGVKVEVSEEDYEWLSKLNWTISNQPNGNTYIQHWKKGKCYYMHRMIIKAPKGRYVDHINRNPLDNRRENLRICSHSNNLRNTAKRRSQSGYRGVTEQKDGRKKKWKAEARVNGKNIWLGGFYTAIEAAKAYDKFMYNQFPEFAQLNFPDDIV